MDPNNNFNTNWPFADDVDANSPNSSRPSPRQKFYSQIPQRDLFSSPQTFVPQLSTQGAYVLHFSADAFVPFQGFGAVGAANAAPSSTGYPTHPAPSSKDFNSAMNLDTDGDEVQVTSPAKRTGKKAATFGNGHRRRRGGGRVGTVELVDSSSEGEDRPAGYTEAETEVLARCWIDISQDPIFANGQRIDSYWRRILHHYRELRPKNPSKWNTSKLRNHWDRVKTDLMEFYQVYKECEMVSRSSESNEDILSNALNAWQDVKKAAFKHLPMWRAVKDMPKSVMVYSAKYHIETAAKRTKTGKDESYTTSAQDSTVGSNPSGSTPRSSTPLSGSEFGPEHSSRIECPMGRGKAKAAARGKGKTGSSSGSGSASESIREEFVEATTRMSKQMEEFTRQQDYHIIMRSTVGMASAQKEFHDRWVKDNNFDELATALYLVYARWAHQKGHRASSPCLPLQSI